jgi:hypothetical protein
LNYSDIPLLRSGADAGLRSRHPNVLSSWGGGVRAGRQNLSARVTVPARTVSPAHRRGSGDYIPLLCRHCRSEEGGTAAVLRRPSRHRAEAAHVA